MHTKNKTVRNNNAVTVNLEHRSWQNNAMV